MDAQVEMWKQTLGVKEVDAANMSPLTLAFIGDAVYEMAVRTIFVSRGSTSVEKLNRMCSHFAKAPTQALIANRIMDSLTEKEQGVFRRGRNAKAMTKAKNATIIDYRIATGFEALIGYLYLSQQFDRMIEVISNGLKCAGIDTF